jgi:hypothetical protein
MTMPRQPIPPIYKMIMAEIDRRRQQLGLSSLEIECVAGLAQGH